MVKVFIRPRDGATFTTNFINVAGESVFIYIELATAAHSATGFAAFEPHLEAI